MRPFCADGARAQLAFSLTSPEPSQTLAPWMGSGDLRMDLAPLLLHRLIRGEFVRGRACGRAYIATVTDAPLNIQSGIEQGCPLSRTEFTDALDPLVVV